MQRATARSFTSRPQRGFGCTFLLYRFLSDVYKNSDEQFSESQATWVMVGEGFVPQEKFKCVIFLRLCFDVTRRLAERRWI